MTLNLVKLYSDIDILYGSMESIFGELVLIISGQGTRFESIWPTAIYRPKIFVAKDLDCSHVFRIKTIRLKCNLCNL